MFLTHFFSRRNLVLFCLLVFIAHLVFRAVLIFYPQPDVGGVEINIIYFIQRLLDGQPLYTDPELSPYAIAQYSPLYYYLVAGVGRIFNVKPDDVLSVFILSRAISLLLNLVFMRVVYLVAKKGFSVAAGQSFCASVFAFIFLEITSYSRPDSLNHVFFMLGIYFFTRYLNEEKPGTAKKWIVLSAVAAAIALFSKQTSFVLPLIISGWMLAQKKYRSFFWFGGTCLLFIIILSGIFLSISGPDLFYKNVVGGINNGIGLGWFRLVILPDFYLEFGLLFIPAFIIIAFLLKKETRPLLQFSFTALVALFVLLNLIVLKNGSNPGYFTEWWTLLFILAAYYSPFLQNKLSAIDKRIPGLLICFVLIMKISLLFKPVYRMAFLRPFAIAHAQYEEEKNFADRIISKLNPGEKYTVFTNYYTPDSYMSCLLFRHAVAPQLDIVALATYPRKKYDYSQFRSELQSGNFQWMLMRPTGPQKQFFDIVLDKYQLEETTAGFNLYHYKR